ncbi:hypothetical protein [Halogeometricum luteum]|uniref:Twin-arginine translocation signal domain-containing protein n=1 Tax=Halogeometricum luteum TaxID=2950537 RepID=A0ABU2G8M4_9EURY|nr:hypothetical protein [Halogeometricum sp. S3BR5-2]MDS0296544.1 hypothetical protein [Halogeometricum sp. S3BR5-2]
MERRTFIKGIGAAGIATAGIGVGSLSASAATSELTIDSDDAGVVPNDTGNISNVFIKPKLRVTWDGFDQSVDKLRVLVEARLEQGPGGVVHPDWEAGIDGLRQDIYDALGNDYGGYPLLDDSYVPVFRETPWLFNNEYYPETLTDSGTHGTYPNNGRAPVYSRASELTNRSGDYFKGTSVPDSEIPPIMLFSDDHGRPEYETLPDGDVTENPGQYLSGISVSGGGNFLNGTYGPAGGTSLLDSSDDGSTVESHIGLRFTVSLRHNDDSVNADPLAMNGEDGYPFYDANGDPTTWPEENVGYAGLQRIANDHPAVLMEKTQVTVSAANEGATATGTGVLGADAN